MNRWLALGVATIPLLTGCVPPDGYAEAKPNAANPQYTDKEVNDFKKEFARISKWPVPDNPDTLVGYGVNICDIIEATGVKKAKQIFKQKADSERDWHLTNDVAKAATATLCSEYNGQW